MVQPSACLISGNFVNRHLHSIFQLYAFTFFAILLLTSINLCGNDIVTAVVSQLHPALLRARIAEHALNHLPPPIAHRTQQLDFKVIRGTQPCVPVERTLTAFSPDRKMTTARSCPFTRSTRCSFVEPESALDLIVIKHVNVQDRPLRRGSSLIRLGAIL